MVFIATGTIVGLSDHRGWSDSPPIMNKGIEIERRAFLLIHKIKSVGIERIFEALIMLTICGEWHHISGSIEEQARCLIEYLSAEIEHQGRKIKQSPRDSASSFVR